MTGDAPPQIDAKAKLVANVRARVLPAEVDAGSAQGSTSKQGVRGGTDCNAIGHGSKLGAAYINGVAITVFAVGGFSPFIAALGAPTGPREFSLRGVVLLAVCSLASGGLHLVAQSRLRRLDP